MNVSNTTVQQQNGAFVTSVSPEAGPSILVTGKPSKPTFSVKKDSSVIDDLLDVAEEIALNLPPSPAGIKRDVEAAKKAAKNIGHIAADGDSLEFDIPIEITPGHKCSVFFSTQVKLLTQDTGRNEFAKASFVLTWDGGHPQTKVVENNGTGSMTFEMVALSLQDMVGKGSDHVHLSIARAASTDGAILESPVMSEVTIQQLTFMLDES